MTNNHNSSEWRKKHLGRIETRMQRLSSRADSIKKYSELELCCINVGYDINIGVLCRSLSYFGGNNIHVIGNNNWPKYGACKTEQFVNFNYYKTPNEFIRWWKENSNKKLVALEISNNAIPITHYQWSENTILCVGAESTGVPVDIAIYSDIVEVPVMGVANCLNLSVAAGIAMHEWAKYFLYM